MSEQRLFTYIGQLTSDLSLPTTPPADPHAGYTLHFGKELAVTIKPLTVGFTFQATLAPAPQTGCEDFFALLLHANLLGEGTGGNVLGLNDKGQVVLSRALPQQLSYPQFKDFLEDFVNYVDLWQKKTIKAAQPVTQ